LFILWRFFCKNCRTSCLWFFLVTRSHGMTMCEGFIFFWFFLKQLSTVKVGENPLTEAKTPQNPKRWPG
jgi:hypothetical protein